MTDLSWVWTFVPQERDGQTNLISRKRFRLHTLNGSQPNARRIRRGIGVGAGSDGQCACWRRITACPRQPDVVVSATTNLGDDRA
jgi:hypothetical protein